MTTATMQHWKTTGMLFAAGMLVWLAAVGAVAAAG
jgi:hypothetical protein